MQPASRSSRTGLSPLRFACPSAHRVVLPPVAVCKSWRLVTKVVGEMFSGPKECENLFFASFQRDVDAMM
ncbi:MAG: hypothetical protein R6U27_14625 [Desulfobacterales bacterium]